MPGRLHDEGFPVVCIPKTMDNDVPNTEYCIGFSTAITRAVDNISRQRTTAGSHERVGIFRIFGRDAGFTALYTAYVTGIHCCIPEHVFNLEKLLTLIQQEKRANPSKYALVVLSEGATWEGHAVQEYGEPDAYGHRKKMSIGEAFSQEVKRRIREETMVSDLTYDLRGGPPDFIDRLVAITFASLAVECVADGGSGRMVAIQNGLLRRRGHSRRRTQVECRRRGIDVRRRALPAPVRKQRRAAHLPKPLLIPVRTRPGSPRLRAGQTHFSARWRKSQT